MENEVDAFRKKNLVDNEHKRLNKFNSYSGRKVQKQVSLLYSRISEQRKNCWEQTRHSQRGKIINKKDTAQKWVEECLVSKNTGTGYKTADKNGAASTAVY